VPPSVLGTRGEAVDLPEEPTADPDLAMVPFSNSEPRDLPKGAVKTNLAGAFFNDANLQYAGLQYADLSGTDFISADLRFAVLGEANLNNANFEGADLSYASLNFASMDNVALEGANLTGASLVGVVGLDVDQLEQQAATFEGATMPDGQILKSNDNPDGPTFEEWLKSKGRGEDG
jgi:uncharacterized protein YjbI with pentapeptide repeats